MTRTASRSSSSSATITVATQRHRWLFARTLIPLALLATSVQSACVSLATSKVCPDFKAYSVDTKAPQNIAILDVGINMTAFTDVSSFDASIMGATAFMSSSDCVGYNATTSRIRYQNTVLCAMAVLDKDSANCKANALPMCEASCTLYANALSATVAKICPTATTALERVKSMNAICVAGTDSWGGLHDKTTDCVNATSNEATTCGFGTTAALCAFCATNSTDACCSTSAASTCVVTTTATTTLAATATSSVIAPSPSNQNSNKDGSSSGSSGVGGLSMAALAGIIAGGVAVLLILFALLICCIRRKRSTTPTKKGNNSNNYNNNRSLARQISNSSTNKYNISAPKIQEEGFSAAMHGSTAPSVPIPMTALPSLSYTESAAASTAAAAAMNRLSKGSSVGNGGKQKYCQALYPYQATLADELDLTPGDIVNVHRVFDDGWAVGVNMNTSNEGAFPVVCVMFVDESALDDDFEDVNMHSMTPMGHREDEMGARGSPRSSMPSRASSPVHLPRRHSSMIRDSALLPGTDSRSQMTSSPLAGSNGNNGSFKGLQAPVRETMMSDASSINRWWDGEK
ncbi:hypothetical protein EDD11_002827 [Mortierella claussenii]|nr:hypothetical protein EDD11_002827 [Mortierella claussenii]